MAGRSIGEYHTGRRGGLRNRSRRASSGRLPNHRHHRRTDLQRERARLAAADRVRESDSVPPAYARHARGDAHDARERDSRWTNQRRCDYPQRQLGMGALRCRASLPRRTRLDADLSQGWLRQDPALPARVHRTRSLRARHRLRRVSRCGDVLQDAAAGRIRHAQSAGWQRDVDGGARRVAVGQLPARYSSSSGSIRASTDTACSTGCGRSSPGAASH